MLLLTSIKSTAYKCIVCPVMEYASPVRHPHTAKNINILESVHPTGGRFLHHTVVANKSLNAFKSWTGLRLPFDNIIIKYFSVCWVHDSFHHSSSLSFRPSDHFSCPKFSHDFIMILYLFGPLPHLSILFIVLSLLMAHFCETVYPMILWIKQSPLLTFLCLVLVAVLLVFAAFIAFVISCV